MIRELKTLLAVAREGTFAAAGKKIGLTQAAISAQMQRLEAGLGFAIFERKGRSAQLNPMGEQVLRQAQELLQLYDHLGSVNPPDTSSLLVNIGAIASVQCALLPAVLAKFHQSYPGCRSRVVPGLSMELANLVDAGELDIAAIIRPPFSLHSDLRWSTLVSEPFRLLVPHAIAGDDWIALLSSQPFVRYNRTSFGGRQVERFLREMHLSVHEICEVDELDAIVQLVANGVGTALVPQTLTYQRWPASIRVLDLGQHTFHRDIGLIYRTGLELNEPLATLKQLITAYTHVQYHRTVQPRARKT
ncbi:LysR family transcriptional regulator [Affinibrenneria salicis]|uniref:LysR family transcriptional regulator n=1 Tax=Affinibrenneria salicis TaxID=2590031 RepID=A0A5J5FT84_9GAMM|nr:LysR family transcriptional regulator [Affinibrenneria salicis]KAA8995747.1 LysR family transcriptional regulator [Affinibrenneria salicis]